MDGPDYGYAVAHIVVTVITFVVFATLIIFVAIHFTHAYAYPFTPGRSLPRAAAVEGRLTTQCLKGLSI